MSVIVNITCGCSANLRNRALPLVLPCGHSFCAGCIIPWYFMQAHECCQRWHTQPFCPNCRSICPHDLGGDGIHLTNPCPFVPNTIADQAVDHLLARITVDFNSDRVIDYTARRGYRPSYYLLRLVLIFSFFLQFRTPSLDRNFTKLV